MNKYIEILKREVKPALGCTEPSSVAYATAAASALLKNEIIKIDLFLSANIIKNGMGVGVPNTQMNGLYIACAAGAIIKNPDLGLELLKDLDNNKKDKAIELYNKKIINIYKKDISNKLYVEIVCYAKNEFSTVIIADDHTNIIYQDYCGNIILNQKDKFLNKSCQSDNLENTENNLQNELSIYDILNFCKTVNLDEIKFLEEGIKLNSTIADEGLKGGYGLDLGKSIIEDIKAKILGDDFTNYAMAYSAAATDARMAGSHLCVMSNSGSGNQGLTVFLPVIAVADKLNISKEKLYRSLALANLIAIHLKNHLGRLSALCGAVLAATGAGCGIVYMLGGDFKEIVNVIKNMAGSLTGMICDGAKGGCSFKVAACVNSACIASLMAKRDKSISENDGIVEKCVEKTISNLCNIGSKGMCETDKMILDIMTCK